MNCSAKNRSDKHNSNNQPVLAFRNGSYTVKVSSTSACLLIITFIAGFITGRFHYFYWNSSTPFLEVVSCSKRHDTDESFRFLHSESIERVQENASRKKESADDHLSPTDVAADGWHTISVFYGNTALDAEDMKYNIQNIPQHNHSTHRHPWFAQGQQDEMIMALLNNKKKGFFVDLAANDAQTYSNTYALEKYNEWNGLCIEPNPLYWYNLTHYRPNCQIVAAVVGNKRMEEVYFRFEAGDHGGIAGEGFDNGKRWQRKSIKQYTVPLIEIFQRFHVPHEIDYLSLDVEGAEAFILQNFPFGEYQIKIITAERLKGPIRQYLKENGYVFVRRVTKWGDSLWIHSSVRNDLNWSAFESLLNVTVAVQQN